MVTIFRNNKWKAFETVLEVQWNLTITKQFSIDNHNFTIAIILWIDKWMTSITSSSEIYLKFDYHKIISNGLL